MPGSSRCAVILVITWILGAPSRTDGQSVRRSLDFLLTNRSIATGDEVRDDLAAAAASQAISRVLASQLATLPLSSSAGGFTYRLDGTLGTTARSSDSFGPLFADRSLTIGRFRHAVRLAFQSATYDELDGRPLRDGTLVATAASLGSEPEPFDVETVAIRLHTDTVTLLGTFGLTDRFDIGVGVPLVRIVLDGRRMDVYRGQPSVQATISSGASGMGDVALRAKYNVVRERNGGVSLALETRLPTGDAENLLGSGQSTVTPTFIGSLEGPRVGLHANAGYVMGDGSHALEYAAALTAIVTPRVTWFSEFLGRRATSTHLMDTASPHPTLPGVTTQRLAAGHDVRNRLTATSGVKWNVSGGWLIGAAVLTSIGHAGLNDRWTPVITLDRSFGG